MLLKNGIVCDYCNAELTNKLTYVSIDIEEQEQFTAEICINCLYEKFNVRKCCKCGKTFNIISCNIVTYDVDCEIMKNIPIEKKLDMICTDCISDLKKAAVDTERKRNVKLR